MKKPKQTFDFTPLGHAGYEEYFYKIVTGNTVRILRWAPKKHTKQNLQAIADEMTWCYRYPDAWVIQERPRKEAKEFLDFSKLAELMMRDCREEGNFDVGTIRAVGVWKEVSTVILNTGSMIYTSDGDEYSLSDYDGRGDCHYIAPHHSQACLSPLPDKESSTADAQQLLLLFKEWNWQKAQQCSSDIAPKLMMGWLATAFIPCLLPWRSHVYITGSKGSGKTTLSLLCRDLLGHEFVHCVQGGTTEAGLRQSLEHQARPVIFDEFESDDEAMPRILGLIRAACTDDSASIIKGTQGGSPLVFKPQFTALCLGIRVNLQNEANTSRFVVLEIAASSHTREQRRAFDNLRREVTAMRGKLQRRMLVRHEQFGTTLDTFKDVLVDAGHSDRHADLYGVLFAGYWTLASDEAPSEDEAATLVSGISKPHSEESDERECINHLLGHRVGFGTSAVTIAEMLQNVKADSRQPEAQDHNRLLLQHGIKLTLEGEA